MLPGELSASYFVGMQDDVNLTGLLVGAVLALVAAVFVQAVIVPWVQWRTRRRERWEEAVTELSVLVQVGLARRMRRFRSVVELERHLTSLVDDPEYNQERLDQTLRDERQRRRELDEEIDEELARVAALTARITSFKKNSLDSRRFEFEQVTLRFRISEVQLHSGLGKSANEDSESWPTVWDQYDKARKTFSDRLIALERSMKPPRRQLYRRTIAETRRYFQRTRSLGRTWVRRLRGRRDDATGPEEHSKAS